MAAKIHIERMMHRNSIAVAGESAASYALVKLIPSGEGPKLLGLNLALVLDVSGSMYEEDGTGSSRLRRRDRSPAVSLPAQRRQRQQHDHAQVERAQADRQARRKRAPGGGCCRKCLGVSRHSRL